MHNKHVALRSCVSCRAKLAKASLTRIARDLDGNLSLDETGQKPGRGAYLCSNPKCWRSAISGASLSKTLRVEITAEDRNRLALMIAHLHNETLKEFSW